MKVVPWKHKPDLQAQKYVFIMCLIQSKPCFLKIQFTFMYLDNYIRSHWTEMIKLHVAIFINYYFFNFIIIIALKFIYFLKKKVLFNYLKIF